MFHHSERIIGPVHTTIEMKFSVLDGLKIHSTNFISFHLKCLVTIVLNFWHFDTYEMYICSCLARVARTEIHTTTLLHTTISYIFSGYKTMYFGSFYFEVWSFNIKDSDISKFCINSGPLSEALRKLVFLIGNCFPN